MKVTKFLRNLLAVVITIPLLTVNSYAMEFSEVVGPEPPILGGSATLHFDSKGGRSCEDIKVIVGANDVLYDLPETEKVGYDFKGWFTKTGEAITADNPAIAFDNLVANAEAIAEAKWEESPLANSTSSFRTEPIENSEEYLEITERVDTYENGSSVTTIKKVKKLEGFTISVEDTTISTHISGYVEMSTMATIDNYDEYNRSKAKNGFHVIATDTEGNPVEGLVIKFKTDVEEIDFTTNEKGEISHEFDKTLQYTSSIVSLPDGYLLKQEPKKFGLGCMYSVIYKEEYVLEKGVLAPPIEYPKEKEDTTSNVFPTVSGGDAIVEPEQIENSSIIEEPKNEIGEDTKITLGYKTNEDTKVSSDDKIGEDTKTIPDDKIGEDTKVTLEPEVMKSVSGGDVEGIVLNEKSSDKDIVIESNEKVDGEKVENVTSPQTSDNFNTIFFIGLGVLTFIVSLIQTIKYKKSK